MSLIPAVANLIPYFSSVFTISEAHQKQLKSIGNALAPGMDISALFSLSDSFQPESGLSSLKNDKPSYPGVLFFSKPVRPVDCKGWCEPPEDSYVDGKNNTIVPS